MSLSRFLTILCLIATLGLVAAGCGDDEESSDSESTDDTETVSVEDCQADSLETFEEGTLTIATDDPAFPPYFEDNDPTNGEGFESAVAYAIAEELGFSEDQVTWV
ncbi:MAG TPA: amino acid ABC transporter substrate-binding protein, partial [Solirubrobacterales bacterium]|nr:amino acid ABC transporter substrate-binding protein [Solirubrobacterales bacterium]